MLRRSFNILALVLAAVSLTGCDEFPKDIAGTMEGVLDRGTVRAGIVAGSSEDEERALAERIAASLKVDVDVTRGATEELAGPLERGEIDIVVGEFAASTPWRRRVAMTKPAQEVDPKDDEPVLRALVRSGENRWLIFVSKHIEDPNS